MGGLLLLLLLVLPSATGVWAEDAPAALSGEALRAQVEQWITDLRSPEFAVREAAREGLTTHGPNARDLLDARRDDPDPEVRRTIRLLLEKLGQGEVVAPAPAGDMGALGLVTLKARGTLPYLLRTFGAPHDATFALPDGVEGSAFEVDVVERPFFAVLEDLAAGAGLQASAPFDNGGLLTLTATTEGGAGPWAADGAFRVRVVEVTSVRTLTQPPTRRYVVTIDMHWLPTVQLVTYRSPSKLEALDTAGVAYAAGSSMRSNVTYGVSTSSRSARIALHLQPSSEEAVEQLASLAFTLPIRLRHERHELRFGPLAGLELPAVVEESPERGGRDAGVVTLRTVEEPADERGPWTVDLHAALASEAGRNSLHVVLEEPSGRVRSASAGSRFPAADGSVGFRARAYGRWSEAPVAVRVGWYGTEEEGDLHFELKGVPLR